MLCYYYYMPKLSNDIREKIAPFLLSMLKRGLSLRDIQETFSSLKPLTYEAIRNILDTYYPQEYAPYKGRRNHHYKTNIKK